MNYTLNEDEIKNIAGLHILKARFTLNTSTYLSISHLGAAAAFIAMYDSLPDHDFENQEPDLHKEFMKLKFAHITAEDKARKKRGDLE